MKLKKIVAAVMAISLVAAISIAGTMAYLTSDSGKVTNTFSIGDINITLDEAKVGADGKILTGEGAGRVMTNSYTVIPGGVYDKDPTVTVAERSEKCFVYVCVENNMRVGDEAVAQTNVDSDIWTVVGTTGNRTVYKYAVGEGVVDAKANAVTLDPVFTTVSIDGDKVTKDNIEGLQDKTINVAAYAYQAENLGENVDPDQNALDYFTAYSFNADA